MSLLELLLIFAITYGLYKALGPLQRYIERKILKTFQKENNENVRILYPTDKTEKKD